MTRLGRNILFNIIGQFAVLMIGFAAVRLIFRQLGDDALGIIYFTQTLGVLLMAVSSLGLDSTLIREVSRHHAKKPGYTLACIRTAGTLCWGTVLIMVGAVWLFAPLLVRHWIHLEGMAEADAIRAIRILGIAAIFILPGNVYASALRGLERMGVTNGIEIGIAALQQAGSIAILAGGGVFFDVVWWLAGCRLLIPAAFGAVTTLFFSFKSLLPAISGDAIRSNRRYATGAMAISLFALIHVQGDRVIVSGLLPLGTFAFYAFACTLTWHGLLVATSISRAAFPALSTLHAEGRQDLLREQYTKLQDLVCWTLPPVFALLAFASPAVFSIVFTPAIAEELHVPVALLCLGITMNGTFTIPHHLAMASGRPGISARFNLLALFLALPVTVLLTHRMGITGAALSWIWYHLLAYGYAIPKICRECCGFGARHWYRHVGRMFGVFALTYGAAWTGLFLSGIRSIPLLAAAYLAATMVYLLLARRLIDLPLKETLKHHLKRVAGLFGKARGL